LFVCGPLFPRDLALPPIFERIDYEPWMPALLACATAAVICPGFNTTWECIATKTPFYPLYGSTYMEPVQDRATAMQEFGLIQPSNIQEFLSETYQAAFIRAADRATDMFCGKPGPAFEQAVASAGASPEYRRFIESAQGASDDSYTDTDNEPEQVALLLFGVTVVDECTEWVAGLLRDMDATASLAVAPYLSRLTDATLDTVDPDGRIEILMDGFAGLPLNRVDAAAKVRLGEKNGDGQIKMLDRGIRFTRYFHRRRFHGGVIADHCSLDLDIPICTQDDGGYVLRVASMAEAANAITSTTRVGCRPSISEVNKRNAQSTIIVNIAALASPDARASLYKMLKGNRKRMGSRIGSSLNQQLSRGPESLEIKAAPDLTGPKGRSRLIVRLSGEGYARWYRRDFSILQGEWEYDR